MAFDRFTLAEGVVGSYWLNRDGEDLLLYNGSTKKTSDPEVLGRLDRDRVRELLIWATGEGAVTAVFEGPMANEIKKASGELGISEQMIVWNAVKLFLEVGSEH